MFDRTVLTKLFSAATVAVAVSACVPTPEELAAEHRATLDRYCLDCHNRAEAEAGLVLEGIALGDLGEHTAEFENVVKKLRGGLMPPPGSPRPETATADRLVSFIEDSLDAIAARAPDPGFTSIHRLNRAEYGNAIRDLLAVEIDPAEYLPADDEGYGFDNIADILRVSPSLLEQYLGAAASVSAMALGDIDSPNISRIYRAPPDLAQAGHIEGLPLGTRGGLLIRHNFPVDAEYEFSVFLLRNIVGYMTGLEWAHELEIAIDGERVFVATVGGEQDNALSDANFSAAADAIDARLRTRLAVTAGPHDIAVAFVRRNAALSHEPLELHTRDLDLQNMNGLPIVDYVHIRGPFGARSPGDTPSRRKLLTCTPTVVADERPCAEQILTQIARRAYRRPLSEQDIGLLLRFFEEGRRSDGFEAGIQTALRVILASPAFLFRSEVEPAGLPPGTVFEIGDWELASRLAFFLWSSVPDDELLALAASGQLSRPDVYRAQIERMLADPKSTALIENFASQWLYLRNLQSARPAIDVFPNFDENLRRAFRRETELLFGHVMEQDLPVTELLNADYTFVNERLASHYGIAGVSGSHFRRVSLAAGQRRGILGHGSILTVTSYPNRTSPVLRGKWILENVLGTPAPTPPPNVPALAENEAGQVARSVRERLAEHRQNPACAACHDVLDPIGLGLENFDAVGRWRTTEPGGEVDASGRLANGVDFEGPTELHALLTAEPERFVAVFAEKLLIYALGRGLEPNDFPSVRGIVRQAENRNFRFSAVVTALAESVPFRMQKVRPADDPTGPLAAAR